ncbi:hypothetical protein ZWY2020_052719 [Hordeum vulgare]|nr:hypothetical protein ZWY2020_052719 [Hordeum vulgare]
MDHAGGGGVSESNWPQSIDKLLTEELYGYGLLVPSGCRLAKPWRICKDGYPTLDNPATPEMEIDGVIPCSVEKWIGKVLEDGRVREWPHGNLALLQYSYWEKVQPIIGPKYDLLSLMSPLMRNWTEPVAEKRDKYDYDYGHGVGMIDDNITYEYRVKKIAQEQAEKK